MRTVYVGPFLGLSFSNLSFYVNFFFFFFPFAFAFFFNSAIFSIIYCSSGEGGILTLSFS
jgi:hypothetical protein